METQEKGAEKETNSKAILICVGNHQIHHSFHIFSDSLPRFVGENFWRCFSCRRRSAAGTAAGGSSTRAFRAEMVRSSKVSYCSSSSSSSSCSP